MKSSWTMFPRSISTLGSVSLFRLRVHLCILAGCIVTFSVHSSRLLFLFPALILVSLAMSPILVEFVPSFTLYLQVDMLIAVGQLLLLTASV